MNSYPAKYSDSYGSEETCITNDGQTLRMKIRGVEFSGRDFDSFEIQLPPSDASSRFTLHRGELCACNIECLIPVPIVENDAVVYGTLKMSLQMGHPAPNGGLDGGVLNLALIYNERTIFGTGVSGFFENELLSIQSQLPPKVYIKSCFNCLYSDYSPYGSGMFGSMLCFKNVKAEYLKVKSKKDFWSVHDNPDREVQETYLCPEFEHRVPGTGYRG